jgi:5-methylcytosine-specific restriction endonuclease McrA
VGENPIGGTKTRSLRTVAVYPPRTGVTRVRFLSGSTIMTQAVAHDERRSLHLTKLRTLVLNADGRPLATWPLSLVSAQNAISAVWRDRTIVVDTWEGAFFRSPSTVVAVPKVMMLREYAPVAGEPKFCRRSILLRDRYRCQYCGQAFAASDLTFDHVIPRAQGGRTKWTNIVSSCLGCNALKADRPANHSGRRGAPGSLRPLKEPRAPTTAELLRAGLEFLPSDLREDFGSWLYWNTALKA